MIYSDPTDVVSSKFKIICLVDLADISETPYYLHRLLIRNFKDSYDHDERFVLFSGELPSDRLLQYIKNTCDACNISASFVLLICPYDLTQGIDKVCCPDDKFDHVVANVNGNKLSQKYSVEDTICPLPWMHLAVGNQGDIRPCCINLQKIGSIIDDDPREVLKRKSLSELRQSLQNGSRHESCSTCWKVERSGGTSMRQTMLSWHQHKFFDRLIDAPALISIDLKAGNTCNFKCRICSESASSLIAAEKLRLATDSHSIGQVKLIQQQGRWFDLDLDQPKSKILSLLNDVEQIDFYGGEPFLIRGFERTIDYLIDSNREKHVRIHVNTNGSIFPNDALLKKLKKFQSIDIGLSIDDVGERFEVTRGGKWEEVFKNINSYQQLVDEQFSIHIYITVSVLNVYYLNHIIDLARNLGIKSLFNFVTRPEYLSIDYLTPEAKRLVLDKYQSHFDPVFQVIVNRIQNSVGCDGKHFVQETKKLDSNRSQDFRRTHREIANAMGYV